jgi:hypothetical protein
MVKMTLVQPTQRAGDPTENTDTKPKIGRPTNYRPEYCDRVVELGAKGYSQAMIIADIGAGSRETINNWKKAHPTFLDAMIRARDLGLAWWERQGIENLGNRDYNANLYRIIMMARFGQDGYREKQVVETVQGPSGVDLRQLTAAERETLEALLIKAKVQQPEQQAAASRAYSEADQSAEAKPGMPDRRGSVR